VGAVSDLPSADDLLDGPHPLDSPSASVSAPLPKADDLLGEEPQQQQAQPGILDKLRSLDQKYLGGYGRQAVLAARSVPDAAIGMVNMIPDAATSVYDAIKYPKKFELNQLNPFDARAWPSNTLSSQVGQTLDKYLPHPETGAEKGTHFVETLLAGSRMPTGLEPEPAPGGMNRGDTQKALARVQARLEKDNRPWPAAAQDVKQANDQGVPMRLTDIGPNTRTTGEVLAQKPGGAATAIAEDRAGIMADTKTRVPQETRAAMNAQGDAGLYSDLLDRTRSQNAKANYEAVRNDPQPVMDPDVWHVLENPEVARTYQNAVAMDRRVRSLDATMGKQSQPLTSLYAPKPADKPTTALQPEGGNASAASLGAEEWVRTQEAPTVRDMDFLQRALNTRIGQLYNQAKSGQGGQGGEGDLATSLKGARNFIMARLKEASPSFKNAAETYGDDSEVIAANQAGRSGGQDSFFAMSPGQAHQYVGQLSEAGKTALRMGVADRMLTPAEMSGRNTNLAAEILGGPKKQELIKTLFDGDPQKFDIFMKTLDLEKRIFQNNSQLLGGSQTYRRMEAAGDFENTAGENIGKAATIASQLHHSWIGAAMHNVLRMMQKSTWNQGVASQAARILSSPDPAQAAEALQSLENRMAPPSRWQAAGVAATKGAAAVSGQPDRDQLAQKYGITQ